MEKRKLTEKQIFRTIVFQYQLSDSVPLQLLAEVVSSLYYPLDKIGEIRSKYKIILMNFMKEFNNQEKNFTEEKFCQFVAELHKHGHEEYTKKICERIYNRYRKADGDYIDQQGFKRLAESFRLDEEELMKCFYSISDRKNQITFDKFFEYMTCLGLNSRKSVR